MKNKFYLFNLQSCGRALVASAVAFAVCLIAGEVLSAVINLFYITTSGSSAFWKQVFQLLSQYRYYIGFLSCIVGVALCSGWIFAPVLNNFSHVVSHSLQLTGEEPLPVSLPKGLRSLELELNSANRELRLWKHTVRESEQRKDDLVVYLAHDLRTPLTSVIGYLELLSDHPDLPEGERQKFTGIALRKANRMQALVEELFEITRFNVGQIELEKAEVNASILLNQLAEEIAPILESKEIALAIENKGLAAVFVDPEKMARAVDNILGNAAHYTPRQGEIRVLLDQADGGEARICISNTGSDIPTEKLERFFEKFYRGDEARQSGSGGSGLGLAIAKNIVEAHGGSITVENRDRVTTFTILLPAD